MYWRKGWQVFLTPHFIGFNSLEAARRFLLSFAANVFVFRRGRLRGLAHWLIMWGCVLAAAIPVPLVWGWIHFETLPAGRDRGVMLAFRRRMVDHAAVTLSCISSRAVCRVPEPMSEFHRLRAYLEPRLVTTRS